MSDQHIAGGKGRPAQIRRVTQGGWNKRAREIFLAHLAQSCNVVDAAAAAGRTAAGAYYLRKRDPAFADLWAQALQMGYEHLESLLLNHAISSVNAITIGEIEPGPDGDDDAATELIDSQAARRARGPRMDTETLRLALALVNRYRPTVEGRAPAQRRKKRATKEETDAALRRKIEVLARQLRGLPPEQR